MFLVAFRVEPKVAATCMRCQPVRDVAMFFFTTHVWSSVGATMADISVHVNFFLVIIGSVVGAVHL